MALVTPFAFPIAKDSTLTAFRRNFASLPCPDDFVILQKNGWLWCVDVVWMDIDVIIMKFSEGTQKMAVPTKPCKLFLRMAEKD